MKKLFKYTTVTYIYIYILLLNQVLVSQNLVKNGDFEDYHKDWYYSLIKYGKWSGRIFRINIDNYNNNKKKHPKYWGGLQKPHSGRSYGVLLLHRKYDALLQGFKTKLKHKLKKDTYYSVSFYTNLSDTSIYALSKLGIHFSEDDIKNNMNFEVIPQVVSSDFICDTVNWTKVSGIYKAKGGERYLTLGLFLFGNPIFKSQDVLVVDMNIYKKEPVIKGSH